MADLKGKSGHMNVRKCIRKYFLHMTWSHTIPCVVYLLAVIDFLRKMVWQIYQSHGCKTWIWDVEEQTDLPVCFSRMGAGFWRRRAVFP